MIWKLLRDWGVVLDTQDERTLARAAAAVGVTSAAGVDPTPEGVSELKRALDPTSATNFSGRLGGAAVGLTASELAAAWDSSFGSYTRLAIDLDATPRADTTLRDLLRYAVPGGSAALVDYSGGPSGHWHWPLRIGVLPDSSGMALAGRLAEQPMLRRGLSRLVVLGVDADDCDLLLLPGDLSEAARVPGLPVTPPDGAIGAAIVLGGAGRGSRSIEALRELRGRLLAEGVAVVGLERGEVERWTDRLMRELSHDVSFDLAVRSAGRETHSIDDPGAALGLHPAFPLIVTGPRLLGYATVTEQIPALVSRLRAMPPETTFGLPRDVRSQLGLPSVEAAPVVAAEDVAERLVEQPLDFVREQEGATATAVVTARADEVDAPPGQRFSDIARYELDSQGALGRTLHDEEPLLQGVDYALGVAFRHKRRGIGANDPRKPIATVDQADPMLLVTVTPRPNEQGAALVVEEPTRYLRLPKTGDSEEAYFRLAAPDGAIGRFSLDIRVFDQLNLIEHLVVSMPVEVNDRGPARIEQREEYRELGVRHEPRAASIVVSFEKNTYCLAVTIERRDGKKVQAKAFTQFVDKDELEKVLSDVRDFWITCALDDFGKELDAEQKLRERVLTDLAKLGHHLWQLLFHTGPKVDGALEAVGQFLRNQAPSEGALVQVTLDRSAQTFIFPWALLHPPETPDPRAFWGVRYAIEQQVRPSTISPRGAGDSPPPFRLKFALYGGFKQSPGQRQFIQKLATDAGGALEIGEPIESPTVLLAELKDCPAGLIYVFSHGYTPFAFPGWLKAFRRGLAKRKAEPEAAELLKAFKGGDFEENDAWIKLTKGKLKYKELLGSDLGLPLRPIVFLNMCQSAQVMPGLLQSFVWLFLTRGSARAVVGTECPVNPALADLADLMGREILPRLLEGVPVGTALREVRLDLIEKRGNPLGLAYTLWGSATAQVAPPVL